MKRRYLAVLMGVMVAATSVPAVAYAESTQTETAQENTDADSTAEDAKAGDAKEAQDQDEDTIWGEVKSVSDTEITIAVGTKKEMSQPGAEGQEAPEKPEGDGQQEDALGDDQQGENQNGEAPEKPDGENSGEAPSMLDLTGEEQTITVTENTVITKQQGGAPQGQPGGDGQQGEDQNGEAPEKPDGDDQQSGDQNGEAPEKPEGDDQQSGEQSAASEEIALSDIQEGDIVAITLDEDGNAATITVQSADMGGGQEAPDGGQGGPGGDGQEAPGQGGPGGQAQGVDSYIAANEYTEDTTVSNETLTSTGTDENAALISSGANVTLDDVAVARESDSSTGGDNSSFYGVGAAVLATDGTT